MKMVKIQKVLPFGYISMVYKSMTPFAQVEQVPFIDLQTLKSPSEVARCCGPIPVSRNKLQFKAVTA
jgi:hypothetical protein